MSTCSILAGGLLVFACSDPDLKTDLDTEGAPEVNIVTVSHEGAPLSVNGGGFAEAPTFCRDSGGRVNREICPANDDGAGRTVDARTDVQPIGFLVRAVFSELIDPDVETLEDREGDGSVEGHIDTTLPGTIDCGAGGVTYDGHYDPSGNDVTAPPGPSLVFTVAGFQASTGSACMFSLDTTKIIDKDGTALPGSEAGPFTFSIANLHLNGSDPDQNFDMDGALATQAFEAQDDEGVDMPVSVLFNAPISMESLSDADITLETTAGTPVTILATLTAAGTEVQVVPVGGWVGDTDYRLTVLAASDIADSSASGGVYTAPAEDYVLLFTTNPIGPAPDAGVDAAAAN